MSADELISRLGKRTPDDCVSVDDLNLLFSLDPATGIVTRKVSKGNSKAGTVVGYRSSPFGHAAIEINKKHFLLHRVVWALHYGEWPKLDIDHINRVPYDNRIENLRLATVSQNIANSKTYKTNRLGVRGVREVGKQKYIARIRVMGKLIYLGRFGTISEASDAYASAANRFFGEFSNAK